MSKALFAHPPGSTRRKAWSAASGATLLALATLAAPGAALAQDRVLTVGNPFSPLSMDPSLSGNGRAGTHLMPAYEPQIRVRADGSFEPALATAWALSADSKEATFTLRRDAKFSDGEPVTADAAKKSIEYWGNKKGPFTVNLANVTAIEVLDAHRFKIKLSSPNPALLNLFEAYWLAGDLISPKAPDKPDSLGTQTFGAGPCKQDHCQGPAGRLCRPHAAASGQGLPGPRRRAGGALPHRHPQGPRPAGSGRLPRWLRSEAERCEQHPQLGDVAGAGPVGARRRPGAGRPMAALPGHRPEPGARPGPR